MLDVRQPVDGLRTKTTAVTAAAGWTICRWGWQFSGSERLIKPTYRIVGAWRLPRKTP